MTNQEMAEGIIEFAEANDIKLRINDGQLVVEYSAGQVPGAVIAELLKTCRADIIDALTKRIWSAT